LIVPFVFWLFVSIVLYVSVILMIVFSFLPVLRYSVFFFLDAIYGVKSGGACQNVNYLAYICRNC
jgi:hypothetical protein